MSEELHDAMNKARIQQSLPDEYLQAILKRCESKTPETDALVKPFQGTQAYNDIVDHARKLESERNALQARVTTLESERAFFESANKGMIQDQCDDEAKIHALCLRVGIHESELEGGECFYFGIYEHAERMALEIESFQARVKRLEDALGLVLKMHNDWLEMQEDGYAGAYYAFVKGNDDEWDSIIKTKESKP